MPDFIPRADAEFCNWADVFCSRVVQDHASLGITLEQAQAALGQFEAFRLAYRRWRDPDTATPSARALKDETRAPLRRTIRKLAMRARVAPGITPQQLIELGIRPPKPTRTPIGPPRSAPVVRVISQTGGRLTLHLTDTAAPLSRGMPAKVAQAAVFLHAGPNPPADLERWAISRQTSRARVMITLPPRTPPGTPLLITARWTSPRGRPGPFATPVCVFAGFSLAAPRSPSSR